MPSRFGVVLVLLFWFATTSAVVYRDVLPRYLSDGPPPLRIDLADEASSQVPAKWSLYRRGADGQDEKIGGLTTFLTYVSRDDTFWFETEYRDLKFRFGNLALTVPHATSAVRVSRTGRLREQRMEGEMSTLLFGQETHRAKAELRAEVGPDGVLTGHVRVEHPLGKIDRPLDPIPVPDGRALNPMMPVGRLRDVRPGRRWTIRVTDPLQQSIRLMAQDLTKQVPVPIGLPTGAADGEEWFASVRPEPETIRPVRPGVAAEEPDPIPCWVIDYRGRDDITAATWVSVADGRVVRQEAVGMGERVRFEREY